jgi:hypothetical protein
MANQFLTISNITNEALMVLENQLTFSKGVNKEYSDTFAVPGAKEGATVNIRKPAKYQGRTGPAISLESSTETYVPLTLTTQFGVDMSFTTADLALNVDDFSSRFIKPAIAAIANKIDDDGLQLYKQVANFYTLGSAAGTAPSSTATAIQAITGCRQALNYAAAPLEDRRFAVDPGTEVSLLNYLTTLFNPAGTVSNIFSNGAMGSDKVLGFDFAMDQNVALHTNGTNTAALTIGAQQAGAIAPTTDASASFALTVTAAAAAGTLTNGTVFTIAGVYEVNPQNRRSTSVLKRFVVTQDVTLTSSSTTTVNISPAPVFSGAFQNAYSSVAAIPTGAITVISTSGASSQYFQNIAYHKNAFTLGTADLMLPNGVDMASRAVSKSSGLSIRLIRQYDINSDQLPCRLDVLYGWKAIYPELACRYSL